MLVAHYTILSKVICCSLSGQSCPSPGHDSPMQIDCGINLYLILLYDVLDMSIYGNNREYLFLESHIFPRRLDEIFLQICRHFTSCLKQAIYSITEFLPGQYRSVILYRKIHHSSSYSNACNGACFRLKPVRSIHQRSLQL